MHIKFLKDVADLEVHPGVRLTFKAGDIADLFGGVAIAQIKAGNASVATESDLESLANAVPVAVPEPEPDASARRAAKAGFFAGRG